MRRTPMLFWEVFGTNLRSMRLTHGWGQRPFARAIKIDPGYLNLVEHGKVAPPSDEFLLRIVDLLQIPPSTLFSLAGRLPPQTLHAFWEHPAIPPILSTLPGMTLPDAQTFCRQVLATLPTSLV
jgi:transcriptional regulator with XRE-family HTH domain